MDVAGLHALRERLALRLELFSVSRAAEAGHLGVFLASGRVAVIAARCSAGKILKSFKTITRT